MNIENLVKLLEQYPIAYTISKNNIPLQIEWTTLTITTRDYESILKLLPQLEEFEGLQVEIEKVRI